LSFWVYVMASRRNGTLYTGHTDDLARRVDTHKSREATGFAAKYGCTILV
jgi:putative endonuclease